MPSHATRRRPSTEERPEASRRSGSTSAASRAPAWSWAPQTQGSAVAEYFEPRVGRDLSPVRLHTGAEPWLQRSPLSDSVTAAFTADPTLETLLARLSQADVQGTQTDTDVDAAVARLLAGRADDLWVAQRVRQGRLGQTTGATPRPIQAFFFRGASTRRALVIAGVHGTERQGIEVARMLITDLQTQQPHFTVIVLPALFPNNAAFGRFGRRQGSMPTNRNFPRSSQDLAAVRAAGRGTAVDAEGRAILPENLMLLELMERFRPERIISIHGTRRAGAGGVFYDPRQLRSDEVQAAYDWAVDQVVARPLPRVPYTSEGHEETQREMIEIYFQRRLAELRRQASAADRALALGAATQIDTATASITDRERRTLDNREDDPATVPAADLAGRRAHPSVAGSIGPTGALDRASWSGGGSGGVSLGGYAPARGMSVFTVEPPINRNTGDYPTSLDTITAAQRRIELQSYADAVRTVLLGAP